MSSKERNKLWCSRLSDEKIAARREQRRLCERNRRSRETPEERSFRRAENRKRQQRRRSREGDDEKETDYPDESSQLHSKRLITYLLNLFSNLRLRAKKDAFLTLLLLRYRHINTSRWLSAVRRREATMAKRCRANLHVHQEHERRAFHALLQSQGFEQFQEDMSNYDALARQAAAAGDIKGNLLKAQTTCDAARAIREACEAQLVEACLKLRAQMDTASVHHPAWVKSDKEKVHRSVCRIAYHLAKKDAEGAQTLSELYPPLYRAFMRIQEESVAPETDLEREAEARHVLQDLLQSVLEMLEPEPSSEPPPDAENPDLEGDEVGDAVNIYAEAGRGVRDEAEEVLIQDPELREAAGPHAPSFAPRVTFATECCCDPMPIDAAVKLKKALLALLDHIDHSRYDELEGFEERELAELKRRSACYSGLRSVLARFYAVRALVHLLFVVEHSFTRASSIIADAAASQEWLWLPKAVRTNIEAMFADDETSRKSKESVVRGKFGEMLDAVARKVRETEREYCDVCERLREPSQLVRRTLFKMERFMRTADGGGADGGAERRLSICKGCMKDARGDPKTASKEQRQANPAMPRYAAQNAVDFEDVPAELQGMNWIERALVQLVRPVRTIVCLNDAGGRKTSMRSVGGAMVLLPVPTEGTIEHVADTLPSDVGLTILVSPESAKCKLVRMPLVLRALRWLQHNNPLYSEITINNSFSFTRSSVIFSKKPKATVTDADLAALLTNDDNEPSLLRHEDFTPQVVRPMHGQPAPGLAHEQYALLHNPYQPISVDTQHLDAKVFPWHFPRGKFGLSAIREKKLTIRELARWWLACKDRRCARDAQFLSFLHGLLEQKDMTAALGIQVRLGRGELHGDVFLENLTDGTSNIQGSFHASTRVMRGHVAYWDAKKKETRAHMAMFGPATIFLTLNPAEKRWEEVGDLYQHVYGPVVNKDNLFEYISRDPYFFARCFQQRLRAIFFLLLLNGDKGPLGKVLHHFIRIEYQHRGTQHAHCMLWIEGAPKEDAEDEERLAFIDQYICARLPDQEEEPELHEIVKNEQMHYEQHTTTCQRPYKIANQLKWRCRFDYPRPCTAHTYANHYIDRLQSLPGTRFKMYYVKRRPCDVFVNDYNAAITLAWKGNTDIQYIWSGCSEVITYVTGYVTKNEKSKDVLDANSALREAANPREGFKAIVDMLRTRQSGLLEVVDTLVGHELCTFDASHVTVNSNAADMRDRMLKPKAELEAQLEAGECTMAFKENAVDTYYPGRSRDLEHHSLLNILTHFRVAAIKKDGSVAGADGDGDGDDEEDDVGIRDLGSDRARTSDPFAHDFHVHARASPMFDHERDTGSKHFIAGCRSRKAHVLLGRPRVPRFFWPNLELGNEEAREDYFRRLCFVFIPWRCEERLMGEEESYELRWIKHLERFEAEHPEAAEDVKKIILHQEALLAQDKLVTERRKEQRALLTSVRVDEDAGEEAPVVFDREVDAQTHERTMEGMNAGQRQQYDDITAHVALQDEYTRRRNAIRADLELTPQQRSLALEQLGPAPAPMLRVILGTAGCGKSFLINALADELTLKYTTPDNRATHPAAVLAAPTGLAAVQIRGSTLHSLLGIEVQHGRDAAIRPLSAMRLNKLRLQMRNARLLIVDELSMVSAIVLTKVHMRLMDIMGNTELFGGINICLFGDLMQLPPVAASPIFQKLSSLEVNRIFGSMLPELCLFDQFDYAELTENMRQQGDAAFGDLLQRLRVQALTTADVELLRTRVIARTTHTEKPMDAAARVLVELMNEGALTPMAIFSTNAEVREFNKIVVDLRHLKSCTVVAEDSVEKNTHGGKRGGGEGEKEKRRRVYQQADYDVSRAPSERRREWWKRTKTGNAEVDAEREEADTNRAAGLDKHLLLAENGRVMLRRNLDPRNGLVNGASGVLTEIIKTAAEDVVALRIAFDGLQEHLIEKVSATFDISDDEQQTRFQFPVVMAFGATVHKSQGMTLSAAIVSTANFFTSAPAQGFVALSRVRTLDTLFLVDLHPEKMVCSKAALRKYNELRATVGLPAFDEPIVRRKEPQQQQQQQAAAGKPPSVRTFASSARLRVPVGVAAANERARNPRAASKRRAAAADGIGDQARRKQATSKGARAAAAAADAGDSADGEILQLNNTGHDCFVIAAVNLIHSVGPLRAAILDAAPVLEVAGAMTDRMRELVSLLRGERRDVLNLQRACQLPAGVDGDTRDVLYHALQDFAEVNDKIFKTLVQRTMVCAAGHREQLPRESLHRHRVDVQLLPAQHSFRGTIDALYRDNQTYGAACQQCGARIVDAETDVEMLGTHVIVEINRARFVPGQPLEHKDLSIEGCNAKRMAVFGIPMRIVCCVQHLATSGGDAGHYVVWRRSRAGGWTIVDDGHPAAQERQLPSKLHNVHIIVFKRI